MKANGMKLSSNKVILETLTLLREHGIKDFVLCPGSRDAAILHSVCRIEEFCVHTATDERSAGFLAIGLALATDRPAAVVVTSGSALANLYPAACEAFYQQVPVVFISADRPAAWIGQMDGQTMPQEGALGRMVKMCVSLPEHDLWHANRLVNEALLCCKDRQPRGPVHINIPVSEPIYDFTADSLPRARMIRLCEGVPSPLPAPATTLIVFGQMHPEQVPSVQLIEKLAGRFAIVAENLSNMPPALCTNPSDVDWDRMPPVELVITLGGHVVSKELKQHLRSRRSLQHWHVSPDGAVADLFRCQSLAVRSDMTVFLEQLVDLTAPGFCPRIPQRDRTATLETPRQELLREFFRLLPNGAAVFLANSSAVRVAQTATDGRDGRPSPAFFCNRGINGIEGSLSTAVGYAMASPEKKVFVVIGDLSFFYDSNAFWCRPLPDNLHVLLMNDGKGAIFDTLPLPPEPESSRRAIMGHHSLTARHTAGLYGIAYMEGRGHMTEFINSKHTIIYEILENS